MGELPNTTCTSSSREFPTQYVDHNVWQNQLTSWEGSRLPKSVLVTQNESPLGLKTLIVITHGKPSLTCVLKSKLKQQSKIFKRWVEIFKASLRHFQLGLFLPASYTIANIDITFSFLPSSCYLDFDPSLTFPSLPPTYLSDQADVVQRTLPLGSLVQCTLPLGSLQWPHGPPRDGFVLVRKVRCCVVLLIQVSQSLALSS